ncbi:MULTISPECIES: DUF721 domain-containing protein [Deinococcus]|uniref:DUF721 domain-containing protein n=1 Tax=Deinococcus TaxID=1298 RepID=UPI0018DFC186|nr:MULTISPECIES: DciA family protein [Deinococcus]MBI0445254.1 DUF721 domain-containing protein [Deinococcus sp. DB0503]
MGNSRRMGGPRNVSELLGATLGAARLSKGVQRARAILAWPQAVGPEIARLTRPRSQQGGTLFVEVRDSATAHHLTLQRHHFIRSLNALLGEERVTEIRFGVGQVRAPSPTPQPTPLPPPDRERARELVRDVDGDLKDVALRAAEAITRARKWREAQGWRPCPVCGEASKEQPCRACQLTLEDPNVKRAARTLIRAPERLSTLPALLGDSGTNAARHIALELLAEQLDLLALECVRSGGEEGYRAFLAQQAEVYLALLHRQPRRPLTREDRAALPERVRQVLEAGPPR